MANAIKGEVSFLAGNKRYTLVFDFNAICNVEDTFDAPISEVGEKLTGGMRAKDLRALITAGLQAHHPGIEELDVGDLIGKIGPQVAAEKLGEAMQAAFPKAEVAEGTENPPMNRRQRRTSKHS